MSTPESHTPRAEPVAGTAAGTSPSSPSAATPPVPATRATPTVPDPVPTALPPGTHAGAAAVDGPGTGQSADDAVRRDRDDRAPSADTFPTPAGPKTTSFGGHLLGILVGFALTLVATALVTLGQSRILSDGVGRTDVSPETVGIVLVAIGAIVFGIVVLLGLWTPAAPFTGGLLAILVGAAFLFAPYPAHRETVRLVLTEQNHVAVLNSITVGTTGGLFLMGIVLLSAATAFSMVRRRGLALGAFRERRQRTASKG